MAEAVPVQTNADLPRHYAAVVVFVAVNAVDQCDADHIAAAAVRSALPRDLELSQPRIGRHLRVPVDVGDILELKDAVASGYLNFSPSVRAQSSVKGVRDE